MLNLDANASYGVLPEVREALAKLDSEALNPSSVHSAGQRARAVLDEARLKILNLVGAGRDDRLIFTSGATEANNMAILSNLWPRLTSGASSIDLAVSSIEHPSVMEPARRLHACGASLHIIQLALPCRASEIAENIPESTEFVSIMLANNETGHILPIAEISAILRRRCPRAIIHCDAAQAAGKIPVDFKTLGVDMLSLSAHKLGGLTGSGALLLRKGVSLDPFMMGGPQEGRLRAGTENLSGIFAFGLAADIAARELPLRQKAWSASTECLKNGLTGSLERIHFNCQTDDSLPNTVSLSIADVPADDLVVALDLEGVLVSSGSACSSGKPEPSQTLLALGLSKKEAKETIRLSSTGELTLPQAEEAVLKIIKCVKRIRGNRI